MSNIIDDLYLATSLKQAEVLTKAYSTSFSSSLTLVDSTLRPAMYAIYGMVRVADEIVDTPWEGIDPRVELDRFEEQLYMAIAQKYSSNPIIHGFQWAVHTYGISHEYIKAFFHSMRLDTIPQHYTEALYNEYIYGSAEVVGLMSLSVFCEGNKDLEAQLVPGAKALGAAFQKVNFLRDVYADMNDRSRIYFPRVSALPLQEEQKKHIELDIEKDFKVAGPYVAGLPAKARRGVYVAFLYYSALFQEIKNHTSEDLNKRISLPKYRKVWFYIKAYFA